MKHILFLLLLTTLAISCESFQIQKTYWPDGTLKTEIRDLGEKESDKNLHYFRSFYENGRLQSEGFLLDKTFHRAWKEYYMNGQLLRKGQYYQGIPIEVFTEYHANGKQRANYRYMDSLLEGKYQLFDGKGEIWVDGQYHQGKKLGKWVYQYEIGSMQEMQGEDLALGLTTLNMSGHPTPSPLETDLVSYWSFVIDKNGIVEIAYSVSSLKLIDSNPLNALENKATPISYTKNKALYGKDLGYSGPLKRESRPKSAKKVIEYGELGAFLHDYWEEGKHIVKEGTGNIVRRTIEERLDSYVWKEITHGYLRGYPSGNIHRTLETFPK